MKLIRNEKQRIYEYPKNYKDRAVTLYHFKVSTMNLLPLDRITKKIESNLLQDSPGLEQVRLVRIVGKARAHFIV